MNICVAGTSPFFCWINWMLVALFVGFGWSVGCWTWTVIIGAVAKARSRT